MRVEKDILFTNIDNINDFPSLIGKVHISQNIQKHFILTLQILIYQKFLLIPIYDPATINHLHFHLY